jgi:hypothetical protein
MRSGADLASIHRFSSHHRALLATSPAAGCFYCGALFAPVEIADWIDGPQVQTGETTDGVTALCPRCGIDAVLPAGPIALTAELLAEMNAHYFGARGSRPAV